MTDAAQTVTCDFDSVEVAVGEPVWKDFSYGVRLNLRAQTGLLEAMVEGRIARELYALRQGEDILANYGFSPDEAGLLADADVAVGFAMIMRTTAKGVALIADWNLVDAEKQPIPITSETVRKLFHLGPFPGSGPILMQEFQQVCEARRVVLDSEKNGSGSSPNGATAAGQNTAQAVAH